MGFLGFRVVHEESLLLTAHIPRAKFNTRDAFADEAERGAVSVQASGILLGYLRYGVRMRQEASFGVRSHVLIRHAHGLRASAQAFSHRLRIGWNGKGIE